MRSCVFSKLSSENYGLSEGDVWRLLWRETKHRDKPFVPHRPYLLKTCVKNILDWRNKKREKMAFSKPMVWMEGNDHITDCYFCMTNLRMSSFSKIFVV